MQLPSFMTMPRNLTPLAVLLGVVTGAGVDLAQSHGTGAGEGSHWALAGPLVTLAVYGLKAGIDLNQNWRVTRDLERRLTLVERKLAVRENDDTPPLRGGV